jgi:hypothetical protein
MTFSLPSPKLYPGFEIERFEWEGGCCGDKCTRCVHIAEESEPEPRTDNAKSNVGNTAMHED